MNRIVGVRFSESGNKESCKYLKVIVPDGEKEPTIVTDGGEIDLSYGKIAVIPPLVSHCVKGGTEEIITILIEQPLTPLKSVTVISDVKSGGIRSAAKQAADFANEQESEAVLNALGDLIVSYIALQCKKTEKSPVTAMLREDIEKGARDSTYSVEAYIRRLPLNYDYVRKLFKKETGLTPHEYLTAVRMERAGKILLSDVSNRYSALTVGQVAEACGFAEPLYFSRVFKKYFGVSPTEYAKRKYT